MICETPGCGYHGEPLERPRESAFPMLLLILLAGLPWLFALLFLSFSDDHDLICPKCGMEYERVKRGGGIA